MVIIKRVIGILLKILLYGFCISWSVIQIYPLFFMFMSSLKTNNEIFSNPWSIPWPPKFENWYVAWTGGGEQTINLYRPFINSFIILFGSIIVLVLLSAATAYGFSRYRFIMKEFIFRIFIFGIIVPTHIVLIPIFIILGMIHGRNNYLSLILIYVGFSLPFSIMILRSAFASIPKSIFESAEIDGASEWTIFFKIGLPMVKSALGAVTAITGVFIWAEFLFAFIIMNKATFRTINVSVYHFRGQYVTNFGPLFAGLSIATIPFLVLYFIFQKQIQKGMSLGAIK
jgi:raffinose/stachyose/melibiose transport system permease protein